jgi:hypothetical protein
MPKKFGINPKLGLNNPLRITQFGGFFVYSQQKPQKW